MSSWVPVQYGILLYKNYLPAVFPITFQTGYD